MSTAPVDPPTVARAALFLEGTWVVADVAVGDRRLLDLLNDPTSALLEVAALRVAAPDEPERVLLAFGAGRVRKDRIACAALQAEPPRRVERYLANRVAKTPVHVTVMVRGLVVAGALHVAGRLDPVAAAFGGGEPFLALTAAGLVPLGAALPTDAPNEPLTVLVNRAHVVAVALDQARTGGAAAGDPAPRPVPTPGPRPVAEAARDRVEAKGSPGGVPRRRLVAIAAERGHDDGRRSTPGPAGSKRLAGAR